MISFAPTDDQQQMRDVVRTVALSHLRPASPVIEQDDAEIDAALEAVGKLGLLQSAAEAAVQGDELYPRVLSAIVLEELAWGDVNTAASFAATSAFVRTVAELGSPQQKQAILADYTREQNASGAIAAVEKGLRWSPSRMSTSITKQGAGWVLDGTKTLVVQAAKSRHFLVVARDEHERFVGVVVPAEASGVLLGEPCETMGLTAQRSLDVVFDHVEVAPSQILAAGAPFDISRLIAESWTASAAILVGLSRAVYEHSVDYTKLRVAHGSELARKQSVALTLVDIHTSVEAMRWSAWRAASHLDKGATDGRSARLAHVLASRRACWIADEGVQFMGGHGFIAENPVEAWYRNAHTVATMQVTFGL
ncbi:acyl-CoA dehydrogenase [Actinomadura madurae]|uniref:acyl-CoA dehydrogenase family protein n=1 Tax=Actinomadura madurae TaxID=1993 RepID=UPI00399A58A4